LSLLAEGTFNVDSSLSLPPLKKKKPCLSDLSFVAYYD
jgi:hypothetical protein